MDHARPHPTRSLLILGIAGMAFALGQTMLIPAIPELIRVLDTDPSGVAWTITGYLLSAAVFTPILGRLGDMFGKRRTLVISLAAFCAGSAISALTSSLEIVVAGRVLQGVGGGIFPLCFGIIRDEFPRERVAQSIGLMSAIAGIGGGVGLIAGGLIVDQASYHWIFWLGGIMGGAAAISTHLFIPESPVRTPGRIDIRGAVVLAVGLVLPLLAISQADEWGWGSARTLGLIAAGIAILVGWVALERRTEQPLADIASLSSRPVLMTNLATVLVGFGMFGSFILIPQLAQAPEATGYGFGLDATGAGLLMLPGSLAMLFFGPLSGALGGRFGSKLPLTIGGLLSGLGLGLMSILHGSEGSVLVFNLVLSAGIGFAFAAMPNLIVEAVSSARTGEATGFNALLRSVGSSLGSQVTAAVLAGSAVAGSAVPTDGGFTKAFAIGGVVAVIAGLVAMFIPRRVPLEEDGDVPMVEVGAPSPLGEPALSRT